MQAKLRVCATRGSDGWLRREGGSRQAARKAAVLGGVCVCACAELQFLARFGHVAAGLIN